MPLLRIKAVSARVSMPERPMMPRAFSHWSRCRGAVVRRIGDRCAQDHPARARRCRHVHRLDVLVVDTDVADMRKGEGDELSGIGRIGEDLLITGHCGIEADFADRLALRPEAEAFQHGAVGKHEERGRLEIRPG
jgi:hypothetical protein